MKRLLAAGAQAIFQVTRSFRAGERGQLHNPEFTIVEWYRAGDDMAAGIDLLDELTQSLLGTPPAMRTTYAEAFERTLRISPHSASRRGLGGGGRKGRRCRAGRHERPTTATNGSTCCWPRASSRSLGRDRPEIVYHYPASQASLAKVVRSPLGYDVAERFELYYRGIELANGFHELGDAAELRRRFEAVNAARVADGRRALPLPESLLAAWNTACPIARASRWASIGW